MWGHLLQNPPVFLRSLFITMSNHTSKTARRALLAARVVMRNVGYDTEERRVLDTFLCLQSHSATLDSTSLCQRGKKQKLLIKREKQRRLKACFSFPLSPNFLSTTLCMWIKILYPCSTFGFFSIKFKFIEFFWLQPMLITCPYSLTPKVVI